MYSVVHVSGFVDGLWKLVHFNFESALNVLKDFIIVFTRNERNGKTLSSESTSSSNSMEVLVRLIGHIEVNNNVYLLDIYSSSEDIGGNKNSEVSLLEFVIDTDSIFHIHSTVNSFSWKLFFVEDLG
jgi:hypothetical protein